MEDRSTPILLYKFSKEDEKLPCQIFTIDELRKGLNEEPVFREAYVTAFVITEGMERISVNGLTHAVKGGEAIVTLPGELWAWSGDTRLRGYCFIFLKDFIRQYFRDDVFFRRLTFLTPSRMSPFIRLDERLVIRVKRALSDMLEEYHGNIGLEEKRHILRAKLYEVLVLMGRGEIIKAETVQPNRPTCHQYLDSFTELVDNHYKQHHDVNFYASHLALSPNYLNKIVKMTLGVSAKSYINDKIIREASHQLLYTSVSVKEIAFDVGFEDMPYFIRFFKKNKCMTPARYRQLLSDNMKKD